MGRKRLLTKQQVAAAIQKWIADHGLSPSIEQLRRVLKVGSTRTVFRYLQWLEEDGVIARDAESGDLKLLKPTSVSSSTMAVPLVGHVPAGPAMLAEENIEGWIRLPQSFARNQAGRHFLLRVRGNSMNKARIGSDRIENGDLLLVRQQAVARTGDIVVALLDGAATVKRFATGVGYHLLRPESTEAVHKPIVVEKEFSILGVVVRVLKKGSALSSVIEEMNQ